jgi:hypothetical protein
MATVTKNENEIGRKSESENENNFPPSDRFRGLSDLTGKIPSVITGFGRLFTFNYWFVWF